MVSNFSFCVIGFFYLFKIIVVQGKIIIVGQGKGDLWLLYESKIEYVYTPLGGIHNLCLQLFTIFWPQAQAKFTIVYTVMLNEY